MGSCKKEEPVPAAQPKQGFGFVGQKIKGRRWHQTRMRKIVCPGGKEKLMGNIFEAVKQSVTTRQAAENYGIRINRNGMAVCPFHNDRHPSMKVDRRFHCFACGADGDVIDFTGRYFGLNPKAAAEKLAADFGIMYDNRRHAPPKRVKRQLSPQQQYEKAEKYCFRILSDYLGLLREWEKTYAPTSMDEEWHPYFIEALREKTYIGYLLDGLLDGSLEERIAVVASGGKKVKDIEKRMGQLAAGSAGTCRKGSGGTAGAAYSGRSPGDAEKECKGRCYADTGELHDRIPA